jgi:4-diphosphocytidyl-2-C-methyl-D-erythritol kinase
LTHGEVSDRVEGLSRSLAAVLDFTASGESHSSGVFSWREGLAENPLLALVRTGIENDFEQVVFPKYPPLGNIKRVLSGSGAAPGSFSGDSEHAAAYSALSGSGSALFGLYASEAAAAAAVQRLEAQGIAALRTKTLPRQDYWSSMVLGA